MRKVLIADSSEDARNFLKELIFDPGITTFEAATGAAAVETAFAVFPDVVFLDVVMPDMTGWEVMDSIRKSKKLRNTPVIFCSVVPARQAETDQGDKKKVRTCGRSSRTKH